MYKHLIKAEIDAAKAISAKAEAEARALTAEELAKAEEHITASRDLAERQKKAEALKASLAAAEAVTPRKAVTMPTAQVVVGKDNITEDPARGFKSMQKFLGAVIDHGKTGRMAEGLRVLATAGSDENNELSGSTGAFLVPEAFAPMFAIPQEDMGILGRTTQIPMGAPTVNIPALVDKNHASSGVGGLTFSRRAETTEGATSKLAFERISLVATNLMGAAFATEELMQDSPESFAAILSNRFQSQYVWHRDGELINGTGVGEPLGIMKCAALVTVAKTGSQTADTFSLQNALDMRARFFGRQGVWIINPDLWSQVPALASTSGMSLVWQPSSRDGVGDTLFGMPIVQSEHCAKLGDLGDVILADLSQIYSGIYSPLTGASSIHVRFLANEQCIKFTERSDARPMWTSVLTPKNGATRSAFVTLAERA